LTIKPPWIPSPANPTGVFRDMALTIAAWTDQVTGHDPHPISPTLTPDAPCSSPVGSGSASSSGQRRMCFLSPPPSSAFGHVSTIRPPTSPTHLPTHLLTYLCTYDPTTLRPRPQRDTNHAWITYLHAHPRSPSYPPTAAHRCSTLTSFPCPACDCVCCAHVPACSVVPSFSLIIRFRAIRFRPPFAVVSTTRHFGTSRP
jgi:hypothetical protein